MINKMCSIYRDKKEVKKKSGKGSNGHMTIGKGEMENITVGKGGGGVFHQRSHDRCKGRGGRLEGKGEGWERRGEGCGRGEEKGGGEERWAWQTYLV